MGIENRVYSSILRQSVKEDIKQHFPSKLLFRAELDKLRPRPQWATESLGKGSDRALWKDHGDGHVARLVIYHHLLIKMMDENKTVRLTKEQVAAIELSEITHDLRYNFDRRESISKEKIILHQKKAAEKEWLTKVFSDLAKEEVNSFAEVSPEIVIPLASRINRVHDYPNNFVALTVLKKDFPEADIKEIPLELSIFREIDSGLERMRTEEAIKRAIKWLVVTRPFKGMILNSPQIKNSLYLFRFPQFEETRQLLPFAFELYHQSLKNPEFKTNQWKAVMDTAQALGAIK